MHAIKFLKNFFLHFFFVCLRCLQAAKQIPKQNMNLFPNCVLFMTKAFLLIKKQNNTTQKMVWRAEKKNPWKSVENIKMYNHYNYQHHRSTPSSSSSSSTSSLFMLMHKNGFKLSILARQLFSFQLTDLTSVLRTATAAAAAFSWFEKNLLRSNYKQQLG